MADKTLKRKLIVLEEGTLTSMALNTVIAREFTVLAPIAKFARSGTSCGTCGKAAQDRAKMFQQVKAALAGMDSTRKRKLKEMMNATSMRIVYKDNSGRSQQLTF